MGVSFKVARMGKRYRRKALVIEENDEDDNGSLESQQSDNEGKIAEIRDKVFDLSIVLAKPQQRHSTSEDIEVSFALNLFPSGFSVGKVSEFFNNVPEQLYPYDRSSETLISAIEYGWLPGDTLNDLPLKYVNGSILCQIRDYRNCLLHKRGVHSIPNNPVVHSVTLQMCMENVVKDILSISDDSWTYKDLLEFESHILNALQPDLCLNPQPLPYRHYRESLAKKINLEIAWSWEKIEHQNARTLKQVSNDACRVTEMPDNPAGNNPNLLNGFVHQDKGVMLAKEKIPTSGLNRDLSTSAELPTSNVFQDIGVMSAEENVPTSVLNQGESLPKEGISDCNPVTTQPSCQYREDRDLSAYNPLFSTLLNRIVQPVDKHSRRGNAVSKRKGVVHPELTLDGSALSSSQNVDSLQVEASIPSTQKTNPYRGFNGNLVDLTVNISNVNMTNANSLLEGQPSEIQSDPVMERLQKIGGVTERYELSKKPRLDPNLERKQFFDATPMVAYHLSNCENGIRLDQMTMDKVSLSKPFVARNSVSNSRTLLFIRNPSPFCQGDNRVDQVRLVLEQKLNRDTVAANVVYGCEDDTRSTVYSILPAFPNVHAADLFASQFTSVMAREGYDIYSDTVRPMSANNGCGTSIQQLSGTAHQSAVNFGLSPSSSDPRLTHPTTSSVPESMSAHNSRHLTSTKTFPAANLFPTGNIQSSSLEHTSSCLSASQLDIASQFSSTPLERHEILSRHVHLQEQIQQRIAHQEHLRLRKAVAILGGSRAALCGSGTLQLGNGMQVPGNFSLASFNNVTGNDRKTGNIGHMALTGNIGTENSPYSNALGINDSKQQLESSTSKFLAAIAERTRIAEGQWTGSGSESGAPIQRNDLGALMNNPKALKLPSTFSSQREHQLQIHQAQNPYMLQQQQDVRLLIQNRGSVNLAKQTRLSLGQVSQQQYARQPQINHQEPNPESIVLADLENRKFKGFHGIPEGSHGWK